MYYILTITEVTNPNFDIWRPKCFWLDQGWRKCKTYTHTRGTKLLQICCTSAAESQISVRFGLWATFLSYPNDIKWSWISWICCVLSDEWSVVYPKRRCCLNPPPHIKMAWRYGGQIAFPKNWILIRLTVSEKMFSSTKQSWKSHGKETSPVIHACLHLKRRYLPILDQGDF